MSFLYALIIALPSGVGLSLVIMSRWLKKHTRQGRNKAGFKDFAFNGLQGVRFIDKVSKDVELDDCRNPRILDARKNRIRPY